MLYSLNQQNRRNSDLFQGDAALDWQEHKVNWTDPFFNIRSNKMNKKLVHISPRRSRKDSGDPNASDLMKFLNSLEHSNEHS